MGMKSTTGYDIWSEDIAKIPNYPIPTYGRRYFKPYLDNPTTTYERRHFEPHSNDPKPTYRGRHFKP